jgi:hypothetical protein
MIPAWVELAYEPEASQKGYVEYPDDSLSGKLTEAGKAKLAEFNSNEAE